MKFKLKIATVLLAGALGLTILTGCGQQLSNPSQGGQQAVQQVADTKAKPSQLANLQYQSGKPGYVQVNHGHSTLNTHWTRDHVHYSKLDAEHRTSGANVGDLDRANVANDSLRVRQVVQPTGYHQKFINNTPIINRGHMIAYSLSKGISRSGNYSPSAMSGDQNNPRNLFTQTAFSNQELQTIFESKVRNALKAGKKVIFSVQPVFKGNNQMASGVHMQAISTDHTLNYNVYIFNVQPGVKFNYANGSSTVDRQMKVPTPPNAPHFNDNGSNFSRIHNGRYLHRNFNGHSYYPRRHHFLRDYLMYRGAKSMWRRHRYNVYRRRYGYHRPMLHRHFGLHRRYRRF